MPLFKRRSSLPEVQNQALIKTARERAARIDEGDRELQILRERVEHQTDKLRRELQTFREGVEQANKVERELQQARSEIERLTLERDFYSKKASGLEEENRELTEVATKYSLREAGARTHRDGHQILPMGSKARTRTRQDRSGWCAWSPVR